MLLNFQFGLGTLLLLLLVLVVASFRILPSQRCRTYRPGDVGM